MKFLKCETCGNIITHLNDSGVPVVCCGNPMSELKPNTTDAAGEKHVPVMTVEGNTVKVHVGSVDHPMVEEHLITWVVIETEEGCQMKGIKAGEKPGVEFVISESDKALTAYSYCNLHGLWKSEL